MLPLNYCKAIKKWQMEIYIKSNTTPVVLGLLHYETKWGQN